MWWSRTFSSAKLSLWPLVWITLPFCPFFLQQALYLWQQFCWLSYRDFDSLVLLSSQSSCLTFVRPAPSTVQQIREPMHILPTFTCPSTSLRSSLSPPIYSCLYFHISFPNLFYFSIFLFYFCSPHIKKKKRVPSSFLSTTRFLPIFVSLHLPQPVIRVNGLLTPRPTPFMSPSACCFLNDILISLSSVPLSLLIHSFTLYWPPFPFLE